MITYGSSNCHGPLPAHTLIENKPKYWTIARCKYLMEWNTRKQQQAKANQKHHQLLNYYYTLTQTHIHTQICNWSSMCGKKSHVKCNLNFSLEIISNPLFVIGGLLSKWIVESKAYRYLTKLIATVRDYIVCRECLANFSPNLIVHANKKKQTVSKQKKQLNG